MRNETDNNGSHPAVGPVDEQDTYAHKERLQLFCFCLLLFVLGILGPYINPWLEFDRVAIAQGQWWRLFTCSWVHLSVTHMLLNLAGFVLASLVFKPYVQATFWYANLILCCLAVGIGIFFFDKNIQQYVGFSGALYGVMALGAILSIKRQPLIGGGVFAYITYRVYEQNRADFDVTSMYDFIGGNVVVSYHHLCRD